jgi:hypothetical protein
LKQIRKRLTYANVMSSLAVFLILGGATAFAAVKKVGPNEIKANSIKTGKIVKEAVTAGKIKKNAVTETKIADNAVTTNKIDNDAVIGTKVNESTLSEVPSAAKATTATTAANLTGQTPFLFRLGFGQTQQIASNGSVSLEAVCDQSGGNDRARILMQTSQDGTVANGLNSFTGNAGNFLTPTTPPDNRVLVSRAIPSGQTSVGETIDQGFVLGPDNKMLSVNSEGVALGLNYGNVGCVFAGIVNAVG